MEVFFVFAAALTKLSMLSLTYQLMGDGDRVVAIIVKVSAVLILLDMVVLSLLDLFQCRFVLLTPSL